MQTNSIPLGRHRKRCFAVYAIHTETAGRQRESCQLWRQRVIKCANPLFRAKPARAQLQYVWNGSPFPCVLISDSSLKGTFDQGTHPCTVCCARLNISHPSLGRKVNGNCSHFRFRCGGTQVDLRAHEQPDGILPRVCLHCGRPTRTEALKAGLARQVEHQHDPIVPAQIQGGEVAEAVMARDVPQLKLGRLPVAGLHTMRDPEVDAKGGLTTTPHFAHV
mmetsp:Transcript_73023/g.236300  ORF Transcript_73023/g.236300 Transcript_73023/m.236300 type:complete len:220 (-) Transcript_73023:237-896(-)